MGSTKREIVLEERQQKLKRLKAKATEERKHMVGKLGEVSFKSEREGRITPSTGLSFPVERVVM